MKERVKLQRKQTSTPIISNPLLVSSEQSNLVGSSSAHPAFSSHDLSRISLRPQAKLSVSQPGDVYEQEADKVAQQVIGMGESSLQRQNRSQEEENLQLKPVGELITPLLQREATPEEEEEALQPKAEGSPAIQREAAEEEDEPVQMKAEGTPTIQREEIPDEEEVQTKSLNPSIQREEIPDEEEVQTKPLNPSIQREIAPEEEEIQTKPSLQQTAAGGLQAGENIEHRLNQTKGGGSPLPDETRSFMEPRFGVDFSQVRVHTDSDAVQMNRDLHAQAFTHKQDIYFGAGKAPANDSLTAHELTHVVQQTGANKLLSRRGSEQIQRWSWKKAFKSAVKKVTTGAKAVGSSLIKQGAKSVIKQVTTGAKTVGGAIKKGAKAVGTGVKKGVTAVVKKLGSILGPILELQKILTKVMAGASAAIPKILKNPIGFVKSLFSGLGQGFKNFASQIQKHLQNGLQNFLFGSLGKLNLKLPKKFDLEGLLSIATQMTGLSHDKIRAKAVSKLGEDKVSLIEQGASAVKTGNVAGFAKQQAVSKLGEDNANLIEQGANAAKTGNAAGFAKQQAVSKLGPEKQRQLQEAIRMFQALRSGAKGMLQYFSNLNFSEISKLVIDGLKTYLIEQVMTKGVTKLVASLTPGAGWIVAAIDALKMLYGMFIQRAEQLKALATGFVQSIVEAAQQNVGGVAQKLEGALAISVPMLIGIIGDYVGVGDIAQKVKQFLDRGNDWVKKNVTPVIDRVLESVAGLF
jgi:hypothetical protein